MSERTFHGVRWGLLVLRYGSLLALGFMLNDLPWSDYLAIGGLVVLHGAAAQLQGMAFERIHVLRARPPA